VRVRKGGVESKGEREGRKKARKGEAARRVEKSAQESQAVFSRGVCDDSHEWAREESGGMVW